MSTWYDRAVFYHIYPLGLTGAPKQNPPEEPAVRRFDELIRWIPHIRAMNCSAVYIGPLFESSGHGYDTRDYKQVDRRLGGNDDFKEFVRLCHDADIKVVVDGVFNHTGREFFAFRDIQEKRDWSPYKDWYKGVNFGWGSPFGDPFGYEAWQGHYELPCLNPWNPQVREYIFDVIRFWIDEFDIDGIRLDCANVLDFDFMKEMRRRTAQMKPDFWLMGEVIHGEYARWVNPEMLHSVTNYELHKGLYSGHNDHNYFEIAHTIRRLSQVADRLYTFVDNHDEDRLASKLRDRAQLYSVYTLLYTLPGIPSIYYGSEWGIEGRRTRESDDALRPCIAIADEARLHNDLTDYIAKLGRIHLDNDALHGGRYQELTLTTRQYSFARFGSGHVILTAVNNDENPAEMYVPVPTGGAEAADLINGTTIPVTDGHIHITIAGGRGAVLRIKGV